MSNWKIASETLNVSRMLDGAADALCLDPNNSCSFLVSVTRAGLEVNSALLNSLFCSAR
jgi:hypothetical protein